MSFLRARLVVYCTLLVLFLCSPLTAYVQDKDRQDLDAEINRLRTEIANLKSKEKTTADRIDSLKLERALYLRQAEKCEAEIPVAEARIAELNEEEAQLAESLKERQGEMAGYLRRLYTSGKLDQRLLRKLLSLPEDVDVGLAYTYLSSLARREQESIIRYLDEIKALQDKRAELKESISALQRLRDEKKEASERALRAEQEHRQLLAGIRSRLNGLMEQLSQVESGAADMGFRNSRGRLLWPCDGQVVTEYGRNHDSVYNVVIECDGIEIKAPPGTDVKAVFGGKVVFRDWIDERGNMVVLDHGKGYYTLYAHLAGFAVNLGDTVLAGRKIGSVGETGSLKGPILHFEIREFAKPQNPRSWLGVKR